MRPIESKERTSMRQLQNLPRHRRFHRNRPTCFAKIGAILVGRHRRCRRFNEVLQLPLLFTPTEVSGPPGSHNAFSAPLQTRDRGGEAPLRTDPFSGVFRKTSKKTSVMLTNQRKHPLALLNNRLAKPPQVQLKLKLSSS